MSLPSSAPTDLDAAAPVFAALGDATRLSLLDRLSTNGPLSITRLTVGSHMTRQAITKHLHVLADAGLVRDVRQGREHHWELEPARLAEVRRSLDQIARQWDEVLSRLKRFVEESPTSTVEE
jgi:DNA-binding transcriptional ArsR family regulator